MSKPLSEENFFEKLAVAANLAGETEPRAPSRLKARIYSALVRQQSQSGPLLSLSETKAAGRGLCIFEHLVCIAPLAEEVKRRNPCAICHARVLAERLESPPIYWPNCPYVDFQKP